MNDRDINDYIDKLHFRTSNHLMSKLKENFQDVDDGKSLRIIDNQWHDKFVKLRKIEPYYIKIFSTIPNCWFHDLMDNGKKITLMNYSQQLSQMEKDFMDQQQTYQV